MKIICSVKVRGFILAAAFVTALGLGTGASAQLLGEHSYLIDLNSKTATDIGTLDGASSFATSINDAGQVAGYSGTAGGDLHAFITGPNGMGMRDVGTLGGDLSMAFSINAAGQVVGTSDTIGG